jgi:hypothetical protein
MKHRYHKWKNKQKLYQKQNSDEIKFLYIVEQKMNEELYNVACFPCAGTVEMRSLESGTQQKENELLCKARNSRKRSHASPSSLVATQHRGKASLWHLVATQQ